MAQLGLVVVIGSDRPVPLQGIWVDVQVKGFVADVSATLKYKNEEEKAVEAVFVFPMDEGSAVYSFEATVEGKKIIAELQEKPCGVAACWGCFHLFEDETCGHIFSCGVGNLPAGEEAEVTLKYVQELALESDGAVHFILPTTIKPPFPSTVDHVGVTATRDWATAGEIPYTLNLSATFQSAYGIDKIKSNCDITPLQYTSDDNTSAKVSLEGKKLCEQNVELLAYYSEPNKPSVTVEAGLRPPHIGQESESPGSIMADPVAMLNFFPSLPAVQEQGSGGEFIFLVDCSGSMRHELQLDHRRIDVARTLLTVILKNLPLGCYFNVYCFGSYYEAFFPDSVEYNRKSVEEAFKKIWKMDASFGGTEILPLLQKIYKTAGRTGHPRKIFLFMDGGTRNAKEVIAEVRRNADNHRCFTFGIGDQDSKSLIKGMAWAGGGKFEFITDIDEIKHKALRILQYSSQPAMKDISVAWTLPPGVEATGLSEVPASIFPDQGLIVYAQLKGKIDDGTEGGVCLEYKFKDQVFKYNLTFPLNRPKSERLTIHRLAAKTLLSNLKYGKESKSEEVKMMILKTSLQSAVHSSFTHFVAAEKDTGKTLKSPFVYRDVSYELFDNQVPPRLMD